MARPPRIRVLGEGVVRAEPDEGELSITLSQRAASPGPALAEVARRSERLQSLLDELGLVPAARATSGVSVEEEFDYSSGAGRSLGHRASATLTVRLTDVELIGRIIMRAGDELDARIAGPRWGLSPGHPAWQEAATRAAANAADKAAAFAAGVGGRRGALLAMSEPGERQYAVSASRRASAKGEMPISSGEHEATATVWATFGLQTG